MPTFETNRVPDPGSVALIGRDPQSIFRAAFDESAAMAPSYRPRTARFCSRIIWRTVSSGICPLLIGQPISCLISESQRSPHAGFWVNFWKDSRSRRMSPNGTVTGVHNDGGLVTLEVGLNVIGEGMASRGSSRTSPPGLGASNPTRWTRPSSTACARSAMRWASTTRFSRGSP